MICVTTPERSNSTIFYLQKSAKHLFCITAAAYQNLLHVIVHRHLGKVHLCAPRYLSAPQYIFETTMTKDTSCFITHSKVWVVAGRSELVASHDKEDKGGNLLKVAV